MYIIKRYSQEYKNEWDNFVRASKNPSFLFLRDYVDYHSDRFEDCSLAIYRKNKLYCLLVANRDNEVLYSHQGLTYGGIVMSRKVSVKGLIAVFETINDYLRKIGIERVVYKPIPHIYHECPSEEDLYALFKVCNARLIGRNISSTIYSCSKIRFAESRKSGFRKAKKENVIVEESSDFSLFWEILDANLQKRYGVKPVHSLDEITFLSETFKKNIKLYIAYDKNVPVAGTILYVNRSIVHCQYISASDRGKEIGALDLLFDFIINSESVPYDVFDFGQSTEQMGKYLNESLIFQKEGFGGRGIVYDIYEYEL